MVMTEKRQIKVAVSGRPAYRTFIQMSGIMLILVWWVLLGGCAQNQANLTKSPEVTLAFQEGQIRPDFNYYYTGRARAPHAIIGIDKTYSVSSKLWHAFAPSTQQLQKMAVNVVHYYDEPAYGAYISNTSGERVGVWYSKLFFVYAKIDEANKTVDVLYKNPELNKGLRSMSTIKRDWKA